MESGGSRRSSKMSCYRTCLVPMCRNTGKILVNWRKQSAADPDVPCPRHKEPTSKCSCTEPFKIFGFPTAADIDQRRLWVDLVQRPRNFDPSNWNGVCSAHFINEEPNSEYPFPILYLGLESWQLEETLKAYYHPNDIERFLKFADLAEKEPSEEISFTVARTKRSVKTAKARTEEASKKPRRQPRTHASISQSKRAATSTTSPCGQQEDRSLSMSNANDPSNIALPSTSGFQIRSISTTTSSVPPSTSRTFPGISVFVQESSRFNPPNFGGQCQEEAVIAGNYISLGHSSQAAAPVIGREVEIESDGFTKGAFELQSRPFLNQHTYAHGAMTRSAPSTELGYQFRHSFCAPVGEPCQKEQCKRTKHLLGTYRVKITELDDRIDKQKREQQCLAVKLRDAQSVLREREIRNRKCVNCLRSTALYHGSSFACKQIEQRIVQLATDRISYERQLTKIYGHAKARLMLKFLKKRKGNQVVGWPGAIGVTAPSISATVIKTEPIEDGEVIM